MENLIILHGWYSSKEKWEKVKRIVEGEGIKVFIEDLPGFKEENKISKPWDLSNYVKWLEDLIEEKKKSGDLAGPFFLLGHSFGGRIAINFSVKRTSDLKGLILVSSAGIRSRNESICKTASFLSKLSFLPGYSFFRKVFYKFIIGKTDYLNAKGEMKETFKLIIREDLTSLLSKINVETLILWGEKDKFTPVSDAYLMDKEIPNSNLEVIEGVGHTPYLENPHVLANRIVKFIK